MATGASQRQIVALSGETQATGAIFLIGGVADEDASWLRKKDDFNHMNVAELEGILKGINLSGVVNPLLSGFDKYNCEN